MCSEDTVSYKNRCIKALIIHRRYFDENQFQLNNQFGWETIVLRMWPISGLSVNAEVNQGGLLSIHTMGMIVELNNYAKLLIKNCHLISKTPTPLQGGGSGNGLTPLQGGGSGLGLTPLQGGGSGLGLTRNSWFNSVMVYFLH